MHDPLSYHRHYKGKLAIASKVPVATREDLSLAYTPGVAEPCKEIAKDVSTVYDYTNRGNFVAVVTDGTAVLGLGDIGPEAALPVMEGKAILFKEFADVDAFPICVRTKDVDEIVTLVKQLEPTFGGVNLEDISAPRCFEIEERLKQELNIPVFHDDQHGTAIVTLAGLINSCRITSRRLKDLRVVISGAGAAGVAITRLLHSVGVRDIVLCDSKGVIHRKRDNLNDIKIKMLDITNKDNIEGTLGDALVGKDCFIGVSQPDLVTADMVSSMADQAIVFAMSNPTPEIMPDIARDAGAAVVATGRSDFPNQINNVLAFPGIFRGVLDMRAKEITEAMKVAAAYAIADFVPNPTADEIVPYTLDTGVSEAVAEAVKGA